MNSGTDIFTEATLGNARCVQLAIDSGKSVNNPNRKGFTPLALATLSNGSSTLEAMRILLKHGADPNGGDGNGKTPLQHAVSTTSTSVSEKVDILLAHGAQVNARGPEGSTPLEAAVFNAVLMLGTNDGVIKLLACGANPHLKTRHGHTLLELIERGSQMTDKPSDPELVALLKSAMKSYRPESDSGQGNAGFSTGFCATAADSIYQCEKCSNTFKEFKQPGQCPHCGVWAQVKCGKCGHSAAASTFISSKNCWPKCRTRVVIPGGGSASDQKPPSGSELLIGCAMLVLLAGAAFAGGKWLWDTYISNWLQ